ncbi:MAG: PadR family transcriptional regulator [Planctomycetota bacterium]
MKFKDCACRGKTLARLVRPAVLAVLAQEPAHGYKISDQLQDMVSWEQGPDRSGVYRTLKTMQKERLVRSKVETSASGPMRREYHLTKRGKACLATWVQTLNAYRNSIDGILLMAQQRSTGEV